MGKVIFVVICLFLTSGAGAIEPGVPPETLFNQALVWAEADHPDLAIQNIRKFLALYPWDSDAWKILRQSRIAGEFKDPGGQFLWYASWSDWIQLMAPWAAALILGWTAWWIYRSKPRPWLPLIILPLLFSLFWISPLPQGGQLQAVYQGRKGDGDFYPPAQNALWSPGQEVWILETKAAWARVQLGSVTAWVPQDLVRRF